MPKNFIVLSLAVALSLPAFAGQEHVTWDQFVQQCSNPKGGNDQNKQFIPEQIQVNCEVRTTEWQQLSPRLFELDSSKEIKAGIVSKKQIVAETIERKALQPSTADCSSHQQVVKIERFSEQVDCDTILAIAHKGKGEGKKTSPHEYCEQTGKGKNGKEKTVSYEAIGHALEACPAGVRFVEGKKGGGKDKKQDELF